MPPQITSLIEARDFLHRVATLPPKEAQDLLFNHTEDLIARINVALGVDAFKGGDTVLVSRGSDTEPFEATVIGARLVGEDNHPVFGVQKDGMTLDCEVSELQLEDAS